MDRVSSALNTGGIQLLTLILSENQSGKCIRLVREQGIRGGCHDRKRNGE